MNKVAVFLAVALAACASAQLTCTGVTSSSWSTWCNYNCNHNPPFCPASYCSCGAASSPSPSASPAPGSGTSTGTCRSVSSFLPDSWCVTMCTHVPPFCPSGYCTCASAVTVDSITIEHNEPGCCVGNNVETYYIENSNLYTITIDDEGNAISQSTLCKAFLGPSDVELDSDKHIYVADPVAGTLTHIQPNCGASNIITSWVLDGRIDAPTGITVAEGGLFVSGKNHVYFVELDENYRAASVTQTTISIQVVDALDVAPDGSIFFLQRGAEVSRYFPDTNTVTTYFSTNQFAIPDIKDIKVSDCGLFITVTDSNQVWRCSDLNDASSCAVVCIQDQVNLDASSCQFLNNPYGLTVDCFCNLYSANRGNGNLVFHEYHSNYTYLPAKVISGGLYHPIDVEIYVSNDCAPTPTPSNTPTVSPSRSPTPSPSITPSASGQFELALRIDDYNTECVVGDCGVNATIALRESSTTRKFGVTTYIRSRLAGGLGDPLAGQCTDFDIQTISNIICIREIPPTAFTAVNPSMFEIFIRRTSSGVNGAGGVPAFIIAPTITPPNTFPNAGASIVIAAQVNCAGFTLQNFRFVWSGERPCWTDAFFPEANTCVPLRLTDVSLNTEWRNAAGDNQPIRAPFHEVVCPDLSN